MTDLLTLTALSIVAAGFFVGVVVGLTGMGGGALMTPALIFLGVGHTASIVTADLTAAAIYKTGGAITHAREGSPNLRLAAWLIAGSVPMAFIGPYLVDYLTEDPEELSRPSSSASASLFCSPRRPTRCGSTSTCVGCGAVRPARRRTPGSGRSRRCWSACWVACWSASPASARARSS